jgi:thioredoxin reductase
VIYNTTVVSISRPEHVPSSLSQKREDVRYKVSTASGTEYFCKKLIIALGLTKATEPQIFKGHELLYTYETAPTDLDAYKGKKVLIIGRGNGAMEFADNIMNVAAFVHLLGK